MDFLGPIFTRVAMRDLGFIDPRDRRQLCAFARAPTVGGPDSSTGSPGWGDVAREAVAETLAQIRQDTKRNTAFGAAWCFFSVHIEGSSEES